MASDSNFFTFPNTIRPDSLPPLNKYLDILNISKSPPNSSACAFVSSIGVVEVFTLITQSSKTGLTPPPLAAALSKDPMKALRATIHAFTSACAAPSIVMFATRATNTGSLSSYIDCKQTVSPPTLLALYVALPV